ncbi:hypothetical protein ACFTQL_27570 [Peribacillus butanolivorans]|uniref:hypothetical protein n=1 Tax=Peribacillus butanolivorans TaxID=421767 RepID=UPI003644DDA7
MKNNTASAASSGAVFFEWSTFSSGKPHLKWWNWHPFIEAVHLELYYDDSVFS